MLLDPHHVPSGQDLIGSLNSSQEARHLGSTTGCEPPGELGDLCHSPAASEQAPPAPAHLPFLFLCLEHLFPLFTYRNPTLKELRETPASL